MWAEAHAEVGISPRTSPRVDCLRFCHHERTVRESPMLRSCRTFSNPSLFLGRFLEPFWSRFRPFSQSYLLYLPSHPGTTWYPTCHPHSHNALGAHLYLPLCSWALRRQKVSREPPFCETSVGSPFASLVHREKNTRRDVDCASRQAYNVGIIMAPCEDGQYAGGTTARQPRQYGLSRAP